MKISAINCFLITRQKFFKGLYKINQWILYAIIYNTFSLSNNFSIEAYGKYVSPSVERTNKTLSTMLLFNVSIRKKVWNNKLNISLNVNDIFWKWGRFKTEYKYLDQHSVFNVHKPTRKVSLSLTYNFSSGKKFQRKRIEKSNREEIRRTN